MRRAKKGFHLLKYLHCLFLFLTRFQSFVEFFTEFKKHFGITFPIHLQDGKRNNVKLAPAPHLSLQWQKRLCVCVCYGGSHE